MKTAHVLVAALVAGSIGLGARLWLDRARRPSQAELLQAPVAAPVTVAREGDRLPTIDLPDLAGRRTSLARLVAGRPVLINVWASWCGPCIEEMPRLSALARREAPAGLQVVGIALDDTAAVRAFLTARPVGYPILVDSPGPADAGVRLGNPRGVLPYSVLVSAEGRLLRRWAGPLEESDLSDWAKQVRRGR